MRKAYVTQTRGKEYDMDTTPGCPMHESIGEGVGRALQDVPGVTSGEIRLVWDPPWDPSCMTEEGRRLLGFA